MSAGAILFLAIMCFCVGYLIGGNHGFRAAENLRRRD